MFKKLRNRILIINMLILSAVILSSFTVIYIMTARNINSNINKKIDRLLNMSKHSKTDFPVPNVNFEIPLRENNRAENEKKAPPPDLMSGIYFQSDYDGNITSKSSLVELDGKFETDNIFTLVQKDKPNGIIVTDDGRWKYMLRETRRGADIDGYQLAFIEISAEHNILLQLVMSLSILGICLIGVILAISLFFANRSIKPVEESYNRQKQFVADASHELKTPLTTINTNVDVLLSHPEHTIGEEKKWLDYIKSESVRMTKLTNDLLYLTRLDYNDKNEILKSRASFSEAVWSVILGMDAVMFEKGIAADEDIEDEIYVNGNIEQLKQLVMILLDNAIKYTPCDGHIVISLKEINKKAVFKVENTGSGIDKESMKHIFDRFYRSDKSRARDTGGYGLGLAIAKAITDTHGGTITAESKNGITVFTVSISALCV